MDAILITAQMSEDTFSDVLSASSRKVREILYSKLGIKAQAKKNHLVSARNKRDERARKLHERLGKGKTKQEADVCLELIRNWLMTKRPMLKSALDFLQVPNDNGLVDTETDFFKNLSEEQVKSLLKYLNEQYPQEHVWIYLQLMDVPHLS